MSKLHIVRRQGSSSPLTLIVGSLVVLAVLVGLLMWNPAGHREKRLVVYCAAAVEPAVKVVAKRYEQEYGIFVDVRPGNTGSLIATIQAAENGDLFIPAEDAYLDDAQRQGWVQERIPLARMNLTLAVKRGNPQGIKTFADLAKLSVGVCHSKAAVGRLTEKVLKKQGRWQDLKPKVTALTVTELALAVATEHLDAGFCWDATADQHGLATVALAELTGVTAGVAAGVLKYTNQPAAALRFARYLAAPQRGKPEFAKLHYQPTEGDDWAWEPTVLLFSGGVMRPAIVDTIEQFKRREGCRVTEVYEGCGALLGLMREKGERPDAYFACDLSFVTPPDIQPLFEPPITLSETDIVILVHKGNPLEIKSLADLAKPEVKVGVAHETLSALGALTKTMLKNQDLYESVRKNIRSDSSPKADLLVSTMLGGGPGTLDAVIVYRANTSQVREEMDVIAIDLPEAKAVQPWVTLRETKQRQHVLRLLDAIQSAESQQRFKAVGFAWRAGANGP